MRWKVSAPRFSNQISTSSMTQCSVNQDHYWRLGIVLLLLDSDDYSDEVDYSVDDEDPEDGVHCPSRWSCYSSLALCIDHLSLIILAKRGVRQCTKEDEDEACDHSPPFFDNHPGWGVLLYFPSQSIWTFCPLQTLGLPLKRKYETLKVIWIFIPWGNL